MGLGFLGDGPNTNKLGAAGMVEGVVRGKVVSRYACEMIVFTESTAMARARCITMCSPEVSGEYRCAVAESVCEDIPSLISGIRGRQGGTSSGWVLTDESFSACSRSHRRLPPFAPSSG